VLLAVVVAAASTRLARLTAPTSTTAEAPARVIDAAGASASASAGEPALRGPSPPPDASVPAFAARMLHGGPHHRHRASARGPRTAARIAFRVNVGGPVAAQVTVSPDELTLYVATLSGDLVALAREGGARRWTTALGERVYSTPFVQDDGTIWVGSDAKKLFALSPRGEVLFRVELDGEVDTAPAPAKDGTVVVAAGNQVYAVRRGGDVAWRYAAKGKIFTAPAVTDDGLVVVGAQDGHVHALTVGGALAWSTFLGADVDGAPAIGEDGGIFVGTDRGEIVRLDTKGAVVWRAAVGGFVRGALSIARNGDVVAGTYGPVPRVVRVGADGVLRGAFAIRGTGAREFGIHGGPLEDAEGALFFGAQDDAAYAVLPSGDVAFRFATDADVDAPLTLLSGGSLVVPSEDGTVSLLLP
jgi:outer membrane protein assembly factor BamB